MGWAWQRGQVRNPAAVAWQYLGVAVATRWALAVGTRREDAAQLGVPAGRLHAPAPVTAPPPTHRPSGPVDRIISLLQQGCQKRRWLLARGRQWVSLWLRPEPLPAMAYRVLIYIHVPSRYLKSP
jgi:hypothetical protein